MPTNKSLLFATLMLRKSLNTLSTTAETVSPVTLSSDWSRGSRLLFLTALSVTGSVGNVFMISSITVEDHLRKRGNSFLVSLALADILVSGIVIPASVIVILADATDSDIVVCNFQWFLTLVSCLVSVLTVFVIAVENYSRLCLSTRCYNILTPCKITFTIISIWIVSCAAVTVHTFYDLGPDYCTGEPHSLLQNQIIAILALVIIPTILTFFCYVLIFMRVGMYSSIPNYRPTLSFTFDYNLMKTNFCAFIFFVLFWAPFAVTLALSSEQTISHKVLYNMGWFALSKSCFLNFLYCFTNKHFRNAYISLFHYCCCKTISFSKRTREPVRPMGDVRVHIIPGYNMYSYTSPQRLREGGKNAGKRSTGGYRSSASRSSSRDVYEL